MTEGMWMRLADVPVPRRLWWWALLTLLLRRSSRRNIKAAEKVGRDVAEIVFQRWQDTDTRTAAMLDLTRRLVRLTWAVVVLTVVVLGATLYLGLR